MGKRKTGPVGQAETDTGQGYIKVTNTIIKMYLKLIHAVT